MTHESRGPLDERAGGEAWSQDEDAPAPDLIPLAWEGEPLVAVMPNRHVAGLNPPGHQRKKDKEPQTYDWRFPPGHAKNTAGITAELEVLPARIALARHWKTEAFAVRYIARNADGRALARIPRINKSSIPWLAAQGITVKLNCVLTDHDTPDHRDWTLEDELAWVKTETERPGPLAYGVLYKTGRGYRSGVWLTREVDLEQAEVIIRAYLLWCAEVGIFADPRCGDWGHLFRMPRTFRPEKRRRDDFDALFAPAFQLVEPEMLLAHYVEDPRHAAEAERARVRAERRAARAQRPEPRVASDRKLDLSDLPAFETPSDRPKRTPPRRRVYVSELPTWWTPRIEVIASAIRENVERTRAAGGHRVMYMALAGALLGDTLNVPVEYIPEIIARLNAAAGADRERVDERAKNASDTIHAHAEGRKVTGLGRLHARWPWIARALERAMAMGRRAEAVAVTGAMPTLEEARAQLQAKMVAVVGEGGPHLFRCEPGLGKTAASLNLSALLSSFDGEAHRRVALSFDKNALAVQCENDLALKFGAPARRYRSPLAEKNADGSPACLLYPVAALLQKGGQYVGRELCEGRRGSGNYGASEDPGCVHRPTVGGACTAYGSWSQRLPTDAPPSIEIYNHALLRNQAKFLRPKDVLVIDEPPDSLVGAPLSISVLRATVRAAGRAPRHFLTRYESAMLPVVIGVGAWIAKHADEPADPMLPHDPRVMLEDALAEGLHLAACSEGRDVFERALLAAVAYTGVDPKAHATLSELALACARLAHADPDKPGPPPLRRWTVRTGVQAIGRGPKSIEQAIGLAARSSEAYALLENKLVRRLDLDVRLKSTIQAHTEPEREGSTRAWGPVGMLVGPDLDFVGAIRRPGPTLLLDANAELNQPVVARITDQSEASVLGRTYTILAREQATVQRVHWQHSRANRGSWLLHGRPIWKAGLADTLRRALIWAANPPKGTEAVLQAPLCLITYRPVELAIKLALDPCDSNMQAWVDAGFTAQDAEEAMDSLRPIVAEWPATWMLGHFGAVKGMNNMDTARTYIALGDPWVARDQVHAEAMWLGVDTDSRWEMRVRADLNQIFGRARSICREIYLRMLHVGRVAPGGPMWALDDVEVHEGPGRVILGEFKAEDLRSMREELGLSLVEMAKILGISKMSLSRYEQGDRPIPAPVYHDAARIFGAAK